MGSYTYALTFRVKHPEDDLAEVPVRLGMNPKRIWKKGDPRAGRSAPGVYEFSYCSFAFANKEENGLADGLRCAIAKLTPYKDFLNGLVARGARLAFFIGWFSNDLNWGDTFDWPELRDLADLQISLEFDVYGAEPDKTVSS